MRLLYRRGPSVRGAHPGSRARRLRRRRLSGRWTAEQIEEEHAFARELAGREIPMVAPLFTGSHGGFFFAIYARRGGRTPNIDDPKVLGGIGPFICRNP